MSQTEAPRPRKHVDPDWTLTPEMVAAAAKIGNQRVSAWLADSKVFMFIVPGVQLHSPSGEIHEWDGNQWHVISN